MVLKKIVSGGQTGADRAALDWAIKNKISHGGWCPQGRKAEDGIIDIRYKLCETPLEDYAQRTEWNVRDSDVTFIFSINENLVGGSLLTMIFARNYHKSCLHFHGGIVNNNQVLNLGCFFDKKQDCILNVAGTRASEELEIYQFVFDFFVRQISGLI